MIVHDARCAVPRCLMNGADAVGACSGGARSVRMADGVVRCRIVITIDLPFPWVVHFGSFGGKRVGWGLARGPHSVLQQGRENNRCVNFFKKSCQNSACGTMYATWHKI
eukprot:SAG11_NODE_3749_length_2251_cov_2.012082_2_plen_109_part_00